MTHLYSTNASKSKDEQWLLDEKYASVPTAEYEADKKRLASGEPLAYVIGWQPFLGLKIFLDSRPLIPRPETEHWVEHLLASRKATELFSVVGLGLAARSATENNSVALRPLRFLDLCAGSGAIGCAVLAQIPDAHVSFGEIDPAHETTILKNIHENRLDENRADIRIGDLFEPFACEQFDLVLVNPPYIPADRKLDSSVAGHEPALALFSGTDGLDLIRRIAAELRAHLAPGGQAWVEVDSAHAAAACALFTAQGLLAEIRTDQYGRPRVVVVSLS